MIIVEILVFLTHKMIAKESNKEKKDEFGKSCFKFGFGSCSLSAKRGSGARSLEAEGGCERGGC